MDDSEKFYWSLSEKYGSFKKVVDLETNKTHVVPTYIIAKYGIKQKDLKFYPVWSDEYG